MSYADRIRSDIRNQQDQELSVWNKMLRHSTNYMTALRLNKGDLDVISRKQSHAGTYPSLEDHACHSFLQIEMGGETFVLYVKRVCGAPYGGGWEGCVLSFCTTNPDLNIEMGHGTTHIIALTDVAHQELLDLLSK